MKNTFDYLKMSGCRSMHKLTSLLTVQVISGHVIVQYCKAPTKLRYNVGYSKGVPSEMEKTVPEDMRVAIGLASDKPTRLRRS